MRRSRFRAVGVGGVDEVDAKLDGAPEDAMALGGFGGFAQRRRHKAHGAVAEAVDGRSPAI